MWTELFWIDGPWPGRLAISARPRGGDWLRDEISAWRAAGVDRVVSLLTQQERASLDLNEESKACEDAGLAFDELAIEDRGVPASNHEAAALVARTDRELSRGKNVDIHCRQGIGRAALIAIALLAERGLSPAAAIATVSQARGVSVPETAVQHEWIDQFANSIHHEL